MLHKLYSENATRQNLCNRLYLPIFVAVEENKRHITIHDIARELKISASTVSRALNDNPRISKATRDAVQELAREHKYLPNSIASSLRKGRGNTVGVIVPNINRSFFSNIIGGIEEVLSTAGYNLMICQSHEQSRKEHSALLTLLNARVDGILMSLSMETGDYSHIEALLQKDIKMIFFDRIPASLPVRSVVINDRSAAMKVTDHMLAQGRQRLAFIGGSIHINVYANRQKGFCDALTQKGLPRDERYIIETGMTRQDGIRAFHQLMALEERPDAIVCAGDLTAHGVMLAALQTGIQVPDDLAISGFANEEFTAHLSPPLTSVDQKGALIGQRAAELFLNGKNNNQAEQLVIEPEVIFRESSLIIQNTVN